MSGVRTGRVKKEDLEGELFRIVQRTAGRFAGDIEKLGRRYRRLRVATNSGRLRSQVENSLMGLVGGHASIARRKRYQKPFLRRMIPVMDWSELTGNEADSKIIRVMPHNGGDYEMLLPDGPDPAEAVRPPSFWRRIIRTLYSPSIKEM
ncbi:MAG: hypothetical protein AAB928_01365 [Patescibacteria group bacterium]